MIFIDRSVPRGVAEAVKIMRDDVLWLEDEFPHDAPDEEWLARAGSEGWLVITHDRKIRTRPGERRAIMDHNVGCFILTYKQDLKKEEIAALISENLDEMERRFESTPRPFIYTVSKNGEFRSTLEEPGHEARSEGFVQVLGSHQTCVGRCFPKADCNGTA